MKLLGAIRCLFRPAHAPLVKNRLGGWRCATCGVAGADLDELGYFGDGYVRPIRKLYSRERGGQLTQTSSWTETRRGW